MRSQESKAVPGALFGGYTYYYSKEGAQGHMSHKVCSDVTHGMFRCHTEDVQMSHCGCGKPVLGKTGAVFTGSTVSKFLKRDRKVRCHMGLWKKPIWEE